LNYLLANQQNTVRTRQELRLKLLLEFHLVVVGDAQEDVRDLSPKLVLHLLNTEEYFAPPFGQCSLGFGTDTPSARATK